MESPDRNSQNSAGDIQGSPLFNFLCSLSPIKSVKSTRVAQTYSEISFPPPPAVFVSPGVNAQKVSRSLQRHQSARRINEAETPSDISPSTGCKAVKHVLVGPTQRFQGYQSTRKVPKTDSITSPCSSPSKLVEEYLADPIEDEPNTDVEKGELDLGTSKCHVRESGCGLGYEHMDVVQLSKQEEVVFAEKSCTQDVQASHVFDDISLSPCIPDHNEDAGGTSLDCHNQEAGELEFLMPEDMDESGQDPCLDGWRTRTPSSLADLSAEQVEGYIASLRGIASKGDELEVLTSHLEITGVADSSLPIDSLDNDPGPKGSQGIGACKAIGPHQRGVRRRCLDFEVSEDLLQIKDGIVSLKSVHRNLDKQQDLSSCEAEEDRALLVLQRRLSATIGATNSNAVQRVSRRSPLVDIDSRHSGAKVSPSGMPSGIGLHLNSLTSSMAFAQIRDNDLNTESLASLRPGTISSKLQGGAVESTQKCLLPSNPGKRMYARASAESKQGLSGAHLETRLDNFEVQSECSDQDMEFSKSGVCARAGSFANKQQVLDIAPLNGLNKGLNFLGRKRGFLQDTAHLEAEGAEDSIESPQSPKKKRRSSSAADKSGDGCKRCNCKKSRCLKLYCECFAAGVYCVDSCTCQGCFNKPEFQETVMDTRQQIESRNPLAFAPKIVRTVEASPSKKDEARDTPASARHKRGCNCKKSHCLKKYCECFQAGVGCSDCCRCDNCKNVHGRKEGAQEFDDNDLRMETAVGKEHMDEPGTGSEYRAELLHGSQQNNLELSPTTPGFQYGGQHRPATRTSSLVKKRGSLEGFPSPSFSFSSVKACRSLPLRPPRSPSRLLRSCKGNQTSPPMASTGASVSKSASSPSTTPRIMRIGRFSPRWDGLDEICTLTPVLQAPLRPTPAASASVLDGAEMSPSIDDQNCNELSSNGTCAIRQSSKFASLTSSLSHQQSSRCPTPADTQDTPQTRMPCSAACSTDNKPLHENSQPYAVQFLDNDNTPAFLKDPEPECLPVCLLNSSSPKHKRVSPPHHHAVREASHRSLQSAGLRSSRKFILQSIPSVPPISFPSAHEKPIVGNSSHTTDLEA